MSEDESPDPSLFDSPTPEVLTAKLAERKPQKVTP